MDGALQAAASIVAAIPLRQEITRSPHAGQNTLASALTWTLILLTRHPEWRRAIKEEAERRGCRFDRQPENRDWEGNVEVAVPVPACLVVREAKAADRMGCGKHAA